MKLVFYLFPVLLVFASCNSTPNSIEKDQEEIAQMPLTSTNFESNEIEPEAFNKIMGDSLQKLLIQQFCDESKGYQKDIWLGLNKCSWAIEKYRLDQNPDIIQRNGNELSISLPNSEKISFIHQEQKPSPLFFQFKRYLPQQQYIILEKMVENGCVEHLFIRLKDGKRINFPGIPYFNASGNKFILNGKSTNCLSSMELWEIDAGNITKKWGEDLGPERIQEINWIDQKSFATHLSKTKNSLEVSRYLNFKLH